MRAPSDPKIWAAARLAARLRARHRSLRPPDALALVGADAELLTLDQRLRRIADR